MGFRAKKIGKNALFNGQCNDENAYTLIIGDNGCGKTQLLVDIYNYYQMVFSDIFDSDNVDVNTAKHRYRTDKGAWRLIEFLSGELIPNKLICASTSQFEKFTVNKRQKNDFIKGGFYAYIGSKPYISDQPPSTRIASTALKQLLMRDSYDERKLRAINQFLHSFGFDETLLLTLESTMRPDELSKVYDEESIETELETKIILKKAREFFENDELYSLCQKAEVILAESAILLTISSHGLTITSSSSDKAKVYDSRDISDLLLAGLIKVNDIATVKGQDAQKHGLTQSAKLRSLSSRSSGEQCLFLLFLGLISAIEDNALICIDEPEISLHPSWQQRFVEILHTSFKEYRGCHFIIATHSPMIVSDISVSNCEILDMYTGQLTDATEHRFRSSDYQLANLFHNPGHSNEYLIRTAIYIFSKVKNTKIFDKKDVKDLTMLNMIKESLPEQDPVHELVEMLNEVYKKYGRHK